MTKSIRDAYGEALVKYGMDERVVVLDADVSSSTKSCMFAERYPERFLNVGVAEANMAAMAAGLATTGHVAFINTFAVFMTTIGLCATRTLGCYMGANVKYCGGYGGLSDSFDGPTHQSYEDIATMRVLPHMKVFVASDAKQADWLVKHAIDVPGPMYIRLSREAMPSLYDEDMAFSAGKGAVFRKGGDATIIACGMMVPAALEAAEMLEKEGVDVGVVDMFTIKPIDAELVRRVAKETGAIITAEEHSVLGGLGSAVAEVLAVSDVRPPMEFVGIQDTFAECGPYSQLLQKYGLDAVSIVEKIKTCIKRK